MDDIMDWVEWRTDVVPQQLCRCGNPLTFKEIETHERRDGEWHVEPVHIAACSKAKHPISTDHSYAMMYRWASALT